MAWSIKKSNKINSQLMNVVYFVISVIRMTKMKISIVSVFTMLFVMCGMNCSAMNEKETANQFQQQVGDDSVDSLNSNSDKKGRSEIKRRKRQRKKGIVRGTENPVFVEEKSVLMSDEAECEVCKRHATNDESIMQEENPSSFENSVASTPTDGTTECETCKRQSLTASALAGMEQFADQNGDSYEFDGKISKNRKRKVSIKKKKRKKSKKE